LAAELLHNVGVVEGANCTRDRMPERLLQFGGLQAVLLRWLSGTAFVGAATLVSKPSPER